MPKILNLYKEIGETPFECLERFRMANPDYNGVKLSYLGRLDPLAEGVMIVAVGEENKNREEYLGLDKVYEVDVLFGIETDTGDILGKVIQNDSVDVEHLQPGQKNIDDVIKSFVGKRMQKYPPYSSKTVDGKPMFMWAREDRLSEIEIPEKEVEIYQIDVLENGEISREDLWNLIQKRIALVKGDFRQGEIMEKWEGVLAPLLIEEGVGGGGPELINHHLALSGTPPRKGGEKFQTAKILVHSGSGAYMRVLAKEIGDKLGVSAMALGIKRVRVGSFLCTK